MKGRLEKSLKAKFALKSAWKLSIDLEKYLIFTFSCNPDSCQTAGNNFKVIFALFEAKSAHFKQKQTCDGVINMLSATVKEEILLDRNDPNSYISVASHMRTGLRSIASLYLPLT